MMWSLPRRYDYALVPCSSKKNVHGTTPLSLYQSPRTAIILKHARQRCSTILFMSAHYGVIRDTEPVTYYNAFLGDLDRDQRQILLDRMVFQIAGLVPAGATVLSYVPLDYVRLFRAAAPDVALHTPYLKLRFGLFFQAIKNETQHSTKLPSRRSCSAVR